MESPAPLAIKVPPPRDTGATSTIIEVEDFNFSYGTKQALFDINLKLDAKRVTAFIGPSGCGKTTLLRCFNRMNDLIDGTVINGGRVKIHGVDIHGPDVDAIELRKRVGMVFQKSNPFPKSIYENVIYGLRIQGINKKLHDATRWAHRMFLDPAKDEAAIRQAARAHTAAFDELLETALKTRRDINAVLTAEQQARLSSLKPTAR